MKKLKILAALLSVLLCLSACQDEPAVTEPEAAETTTEEPTTVDIPEDTTVLVPVYENLYSAAMPVTTEYGYDENGDAIFSYSYQTLHLILPDREVADKVIIDFLNRVEQTREDAQQLHNHASNQAHSSAVTEPYTYQVQYNTTRIDQGVLSMFGQTVQSGDSLHSNRQCISANYDLVTGDVLTLGSILYRADSKEPLSKLVIDNLKQQNNINLYDDFEQIVTQRFNRDESTDEDFYFTPYGLCFYFSPYELAPYSAGTITAQIPYQELTGIIGDAYFPTEKTYSSGIVSINDFSDADLDSYEQFSEIILDSEAPMLLITAEGSVLDLRIAHTDSSGYSKTVFAANVLSETNAILLEAQISADAPDLILSYSTAGTSYEFYIVSDPDDGSIKLQPIE